MSIGIDACRIALIGFIIPFVLVYNPSLSLVTGFTFAGLAWICLRLSLAIWLFSTGFTGYAAGRIGLPQRALRLALGLVILVSTLWVEALATAVALALTGMDYASRDRDEQAGAAPPAQGRKNA